MRVTRRTAQIKERPSNCKKKGKIIFSHFKSVTVKERRRTRNSHSIQFISTSAREDQMQVIRGVTSRMCLKDVRNIFPLSVSKKEEMLLVTKLTKHLLYIRYNPHATDPHTLRSEVRPHRAAGGTQGFNLPLSISSALSFLLTK